MSRIKGLNDTITLKKKAIKPAITVWKGGKKTKTSAGKSLNEKFRIEAPKHLRSIIAAAYNAEEKDGSLFVEQINLVPAYEDEFKTFISKMAAYTASRPLHFCDRETIYTEFIEDKDPKGNIYFQPIESSKPCPVAGKNYECPRGCSRTGDFYFYIWELLLAGCAEFARLQVHGVEDNKNLADVLDTTKLEIGAIKTSPFVSEETRSYIMYQLTRRQDKSKFPIKENGIRTAKRGKREDWICNLQLHPLWLSRYQYYKQSQQLQALNYQPSLKLIHQVYGENMIALGETLGVEHGRRQSLQRGEPAQRAALGTRPFPPTQNLNSLPPAIPQDNLAEFKQQLTVAFKNNGWTKDGWFAMMIDTFGTTEVSADLDLDLLLAIANSGEEREKWCEL